MAFCSSNACRYAILFFSRFLEGRTIDAYSKGVTNHTSAGALYSFTLRLKLSMRMPENTLLERKKKAMQLGIVALNVFVLMHFNLISYSFRGFM
jgi:hypothetical protein